MAAISKVDNSNPEVGVTRTIDPNDYKVDLRSAFARSKWSNKAEFELVKDVRKRFRDMELGRRTQCYWAVPPSEGGTVERTSDGEIMFGIGSDWAMHWNLCYKLWSQWKQYLNGRSNLKSPMSLAPVEAFMAEFYKNPIGVVLNPTCDDDKTVAEVFKDYIAYLESIGIDESKKTVAKETAITGTGIFYNGYLHKEHEVDFILADDEIEKEVSRVIDKGSEEDIANLQKRLDEEKKPLTKKGKIVEYSDAVVIPVNIYEFYPDPDARCLEGFTHEAIDCVWRTTPSMEQFRAEFVNSRDPYIKKDNIDRVKSAYSTFVAYGNLTGQKPFFQMPKDIVTSSNRVEVLKYYNKQTDKYIVIANDIVIRDGPLPYNHKKLPFSVAKYIDFPNQFYGIGIPAVVESLQSEDETLRNMAIEALKKVVNPAIFISSLVFGQVDSQWDRVEAGMKIEIDGNPNENIAWDKGPANLHIGEIMQMRADIQKDAMQATGINSLQYSVPKANEPVRNNMLMQASTQLMMAKAMENIGTAYRRSIEQIILVVQQILPDSYEIIKDEDTEDIVKSYKTIPVKNKQYKATPAGMEIEPIEGVSEVEMSPEKVKSKKKILVQVDLDRITPLTQAMKVQNVQNALQFLVPILANPTLMTAPGVSELVKDYIDYSGLSRNIYDKIQDSDSEDDENSAKEQIDKMMQGKAVPGIPGESDAHKIIHSMALLDAVTERDDPKTDPARQQVLQQYISLLAQHLQTDNAPRQMIENTALQAAQPPQPPMQPNMGGGMMTPQNPMQMAMAQGAMSPNQPIGGGMPGNPQVANAGAMSQ